MNRTDTTTDVTASLLREGFSFPSKHEEHQTKDLPRDMDELNNVELGNHLGIWSNSYSRALFELARSKSDVIMLSARMKKIRNAALGEAKKGTTVAFAKAQVEAREDMQELQDQLNVAEAEVLLLESLADGYKKKYDAVSREIARRQHEKDAFNR